MALFQFQWLRRLIRKNTNPISETDSYLWKKRLSLAYVLLSWNAFGLIIYMAYNGYDDWAKDYKSEFDKSLTPAQQWSTTLGIKEAKVLRISGFNVKEYEIGDKKSN